MFRKCVEEEKAWAEYLFKDGSMIGLNDKLLHQYVEWIANKRMKAIGLDPIYDIPLRNNPLPWTEHWISSKGLQVAPQETEVESYIVGGIKQDVKKIPSLDSNSDIEWDIEDMYDAYRNAADDYEQVMKQLEDENSKCESEGT